MSAFLCHHFSEVTDYSFTADMETEVIFFIVLLHILFFITFCNLFVWLMLPREFLNTLASFMKWCYVRVIVNYLVYLSYPASCSLIQDWILVSCDALKKKNWFLNFCFSLIMYLLDWLNGKAFLEIIGHDSACTVTVLIVSIFIRYGCFLWSKALIVLFRDDSISLHNVQEFSTTMVV